MNRAQRRSKVRKNELKGQTRPKYSLEAVQRAINIAIEMKKLSKGHLYSKALKNRCVFCGQSMKTKKQCEYWAMTLIDRIQTVLINPSYFTDNEIQALWLQHGEEYQNIKLPLVFEGKDEPKKT